MNYYYSVAHSKSAADSNFTGRKQVTVRRRWGVIDDDGVPMIDVVEDSTWRFRPGGRFPKLATVLAPAIDAMSARSVDIGLVITDQSGPGEDGMDTIFYIQGPLEDGDELEYFEAGDGARAQLDAVLYGAFIVAGKRIRELREAGVKTDPAGAE